MRVHFGLNQFQAEWPRSAVCVGTFDGVHLGHRAVIEEAVEAARDLHAPCVLATFDRHPMAVLAPDRCPPMLASPGSNLARFAGLGVDVAVVLPFDQAMSRMPAEEFFGAILVEALRAERMSIGHDFAFGRGRQGTPEWLSKRIDTRIVPAMALGGVRVSSTAIREAVARGEVETAHALLGRPFTVEGVVVEGRKLGRELGYPTLNLARSVPQVTPADGVYAGSCDTPLGTFRSAVSIGVRPALGPGARTIEAYLLDYPGESLYGRSVELHLLRRLREERDFPTVEALKEQIARDVECVAQGG